MEMASTGYLSYQKVYFGQISPAQGGQEIYELIVRMMNK
jgi:multiple sugar transport system substrate-binding protein